MEPMHSDVMIHIDETLDDDRLREIERLLGEHEGVISACVSEKARHMLMVDYDHDKLGSRDLLAWVQGQGVHAELVGL